MGILRLTGKFFLALGVFILLVNVAFFLTLAYQSMREPVVEFDDFHVQSAFEWSRQTGAPTQLLHSHYPPTNWAGDFEKLFALQLEPEITEEIIRRQDVVRGDQLPEDLLQAVRFAMFFSRDLTWFPAEEEILTEDYFVSPIRIVTQGGYPDAVHLVIIHPGDRILYFVAAKM